MLYSYFINKNTLFTFMIITTLSTNSRFWWAPGRESPGCPSLPLLTPQYLVSHLPSFPHIHMTPTSLGILLLPACEPSQHNSYSQPPILPAPFPQSQEFVQAS